MSEGYNDQLLIGTEVESEHMKTWEWLAQCMRDDVMPSPHALFCHIAMDHIREKTDYYTKLEKAGL